jgi:hypothetical protein
MLPLQFFGQDIHFVIGLFAALVFFAVFWLYFDAWLGKRSLKIAYKWIGFLLISLSFVVYATLIEQSVLGRSLLGNVSETVSQILRVAGYIFVLVGRAIDPIQKRPGEENSSASFFGKLLLYRKKASDEQIKGTPGFLGIGMGSVFNPLHFFPPLGVLAICILYWRKATTGLERHLRPMAIAFSFLFGFELLNLASLWSSSSNPQIAKLVAPFGTLWIIDQLLLLISVSILGFWVWQYLTKRFISQLFMIFISMALGTFLLTTICFTYLLVNSVQNSALNNLNTAASVLSYAINTKKAETLADSETVAENPVIASAVASSNHDQLVSLTSKFLYTKNESSLVITNNNAEVLLRAENPDKYGDSLSSNTLIRRALIGEEASSVSTVSGVLSPTLYIQSATPIRNAQQQIVGASVVSFAVDSAFVDGIKHSTGLDSSIYAGNVVSATTFLAPDGVTRWTGLKETNSTIDRTVLVKDETYKGTLSILNQQYLGVYLPLKNVDNTVIGMLFLGQPSSNIVKTAGHSIELTFVVTVILLLLSITPAYLLARQIAKQLE